MAITPSAPPHAWPGAGHVVQPQHPPRWLWTDLSALPPVEGNVNTALSWRLWGSYQPAEPAINGGAVPGSCGGSRHTDRHAGSRRATPSASAFPWR